MEKHSVAPTTRKTLILGWLICGLGALFYCYEYLLRIEPSVMVSQLMQKYQLSAEHFGLFASLYYIAYTPMQLVVGVATDMYGPRRMLTMAILVCTLGSALFGASDSIVMAGLGRFCIGFGSAFAFVGVLKLASIWLPSKRFALFAGLSTALGMIGAMVGDIQLSVLVHKIGWQDTIFIGTVIGMILSPLIWIFIRDSHSGMYQDEEREHVSFKEALGGIKHIATNPQMWLTGLIGCALFLSLSVFAELWGIDFLTHVYGYTSQQAASATSKVFLGWLIGAPLSGYISDHLRSRRIPILFGIVLSIICIIWIIYFPIENLMLTNIILILFGVFSSVEVVTFAIARENCPEHMAGAAISFVNMLVMAGGFLFQPLVGFILDRFWAGQLVDGVRQYSAQDYQVALAVIPICILASGILLLWLNESYNVPVEEG